MKILTQLSLEVGGRKCIGAWKIHRQRQQAFINYLYLNEAVGLSTRLSAALSAAALIKLNKIKPTAAALSTIQDYCPITIFLGVEMLASFLTAAT